MAILESDKIDFITKTVKRDEEECYIMIRQLIQEVYVTIVNIHSPNLGAPKSIQQILTNIKREIDRNIIKPAPRCHTQTKALQKRKISDQHH